jgi:drug/metabolite transporter (DMT)-like permease
MLDDSPRPYLWMLLGSLCFACMGTMANATVAYLPWQLVAVMRSVIPFLLVVFWALSAGVSLVFWSPGILWLRSISGSISLISTFFALSRLPAPEVFTITNMFPLWVALLSWPMLGEVPSVGTWISVLCGVAGVFVIYPPTFLFGAATPHQWPILVAVLASISTAFAMLGLNRLRNIDNRAVVVHFSFTALVFASASYFVFDRSEITREPNLASLASILGVGLAATMGQLLLTKAFTSGHAAKVAVVNLAQIPMTLALQLIFFDDYRIDAQKIVGMGLVLGPTAWLMARQRFQILPPDQEPLEGEGFDRDPV